MSTINTDQKKRGRPRVDSEEVKIRFQRPQLNQIDDFAGSYGIGRPEAVRALVSIAFKLTPTAERLAHELEDSGDAQGLSEAQEIRNILDGR